jgi:hypothetical protein
MKHLLLLPLVLLLLSAPSLLTACGSGGSSSSPVPPFHYSLPLDLEQKQTLYRSLVPSVQNPNGFIETDKCDSLQMTALLGASGVNVPNLPGAEPSPGKWLRRDTASGSCYPVGSGSEISRDMLLGVMWYAWSHKDLSMLERMYQYGEQNNWVMGAGDIARTGFRTLRGTLAAEIHVLGGKHRPSDELLADPQVLALDGYGAHLQALHILLRGEIYGQLSNWSRHQLRKLADENPDSPLMNAAAARWIGGEYLQKYISAASNTTYFPADRLPTSADRCIDWATQQKNPKDWAPCPEENRIHSGGDWLFAAYIFQLQ